MNYVVEFEWVELFLIRNFRHVFPLFRLACLTEKKPNRKFRFFCLKCINTEMNLNKGNWTHEV